MPGVEKIGHSIFISPFKILEAFNWKIITFCHFRQISLSRGRVNLELYPHDQTNNGQFYGF